MLFKFDRHWKTVVWIVGPWIAYGLFGFEFTAITLLSILILKNIRK